MKIALFFTSLILYAANCFAGIDPYHRILHKFDKTNRCTDYSSPSNLNRQFKTGIPLADTAKNYNWDTAKQAYVYINKTFYKYSHGAKISLAVTIDSNNIDTLQKLIINYNSKEQVISSFYNDYIAGKISDSSRTFVTYDNIANESELTEESFINGAWQLSYMEKFSYIYDSKNFITSVIKSEFNGVDTVYDYRERLTLNADGSWNFLYHDLYDTTLNQWANDYEIDSASWHSWYKNGLPDFYASANEQPAEYIYRQWDGAKWVDSLKYLWIYDKNEGYVELFQMKKNGFWVDSARQTIGIDSLGHYVKNLIEEKRNNKWITDYSLKNIADYDSIGYLKQLTAEELDTLSGKFVPLGKTIYGNYLIYGGIKTDIHPLYSIFPNPASDMLNVLVPGNESSIGIDIINTQGKVINTYTAVSGIVVNISLKNIAPGFYIVNLKTGRGVVPYKLLKTN